MNISDQDVSHVARLARLQLTKEELARYRGQLASILGYVEKLKELNTDGVEPMTHVWPMANRFREDEVRANEFGDPASLLDNAPEREGPFFKVNKVIE